MMKPCQTPSPSHRRRPRSLSPQLGASLAAQARRADEIVGNNLISRRQKQSPVFLSDCISVGAGERWEPRPQPTVTANPQLAAIVRAADWHLKKLEQVITFKTQNKQKKV